MTDDTPDCPDCGVATEAMRLRSGGHALRFVSEENRDGILGTLGAKQTYDAEAVVCPECGLSRLYADVGDGDGDERTDEGMGDIFEEGSDDVTEPTEEPSSTEDDEGWTFE